MVLGLRARPVPFHPIQAEYTSHHSELALEQVLFPPPLPALHFHSPGPWGTPGSPAERALGGDFPLPTFHQGDSHLLQTTVLEAEGSLCALPTKLPRGFPGTQLLTNEFPGLQIPLPYKTNIPGQWCPQQQDVIWLHSLLCSRT